MATSSHTKLALCSHTSTPLHLPGELFLKSELEGLCLVPPALTTELDPPLFSRLLWDQLLENTSCPQLFLSAFFTHLEAFWWGGAEVYVHMGLCAQGPSFLLIKLLGDSMKLEQGKSNLEATWGPGASTET